MLLGGRYELLESIGRGGTATVYRAQDVHMERPVSVKVLRADYSTYPEYVTGFQRAAKAASLLQHPNIVQTYDYGESSGIHYTVMELIDGTNLRRYLRSRGILAVGHAVNIAHDVALGLGAAHRRDMVHLAVSPHTILVGRDGLIKLIGFGRTMELMRGNIQCYAPEQMQGEIATPAIDIYALGNVMYEMLTGRTPFDGDTPVAVAMQHIQDAPMPPSLYNPNIPPALEAIILRCLEKVPEMRYHNGSVLAQALEAFMDKGGMLR